MVVGIITGVEGTDTEGAGGNVALPPAIAVLGGLTVASGLFRGASSFWHGYQRWQDMDENERYWNDYARNTGYSPRYPRRTGAYNDRVGVVLDSLAGVSSSASGAYGGWYGSRPREYRPDSSWNPYDNGYY